LCITILYYQTALTSGFDNYQDDSGLMKRR
jgi:hypothetical protein